MSTDSPINAEQRIFTTGEAAKVCGVSQQTIIRCFDTGRLTGFRVPGSRFRRIPREELLRFMRANGMSLDRLEGTSAYRVLLVCGDAPTAKFVESAIKEHRMFTMCVATSAFDAGALTASFRPTIVILGVGHGEIDALALCRSLRARPQSPAIRVVCLGSASEAAKFDAFRRAGAEDCVTLPCTGEQLLGRLHAMIAKPVAP